MNLLLRALVLAVLLLIAAPIALVALVILVPITAPLLAAAALLGGGILIALLPLAVLALPFLLIYALVRLLARDDAPKATA